MQIILASSDGTRRYVYASPTHLKPSSEEDDKKNQSQSMILNRKIGNYTRNQVINEDQEHEVIFPLQQYNRVFLVAKPTSQTVRLAIATKGVVNQNTWNKRVEEAKKSGKRLHLCHGWEDEHSTASREIPRARAKEYLWREEYRANYVHFWFYLGAEASNFY